MVTSATPAMSPISETSQLHVLYTASSLQMLHIPMTITQLKHFPVKDFELTLLGFFVC